MDSKYIITGGTLTDIADAIRTQENTNETIPTTEFARHIAAIEPGVEEYMRMTDYLNYPKVINELDYDEKNITKCTQLYNFYAEMEDVNNG